MNIQHFHFLINVEYDTPEIEVMTYGGFLKADSKKVDCYSMAV